MKTNINILHLEDDCFDGALVSATLREGGIAFTIDRIETEDCFVDRLARGGIDLILADLKLPSFDGMTALAIARQERPLVPFIFVSGTLGEERAIESLQNGATDYVLKNNLSRLPDAVKRAMQDVQARSSQIQFDTRACFRKKLVIPPTKTTRSLPRIV